MLIHGLGDRTETWQEGVRWSNSGQRPLLRHIGIEGSRVGSRALTVNDVTAVAVGMWRLPQYSFPVAVRPTTAAGPTPAPTSAACPSREAVRQRDGQKDIKSIIGASSVKIVCTTINQMASDLSTILSEYFIEQSEKYPRGKAAMRPGQFALQVTMQHDPPSGHMLLDSVCIPHVPTCWGCMSAPAGI